MVKCMTCRLCFTQPTEYYIVYGRKINGSALPVCVYCIPPWINGMENWWYERLDNSRRPTPEQLSEAWKQRRSPKPRLLVDESMKQKYSPRNLPEEFHIKELLSYWDENLQKYTFQEERVIWKEKEQTWVYPSYDAKLLIVVSILVNLPTLNPSAKSHPKLFRNKKQLTMQRLEISFSFDGVNFGIGRSLGDIDFRSTKTPDPQSAYWCEVFGDWGCRTEDKTLKNQKPTEIYRDPHRNGYCMPHSEELWLADGVKFAKVRLSERNEKAQIICEEIVDISQIWTTTPDKKQTIVVVPNANSAEQLVRSIEFQVIGKEKIIQLSALQIGTRWEKENKITRILSKCCVTNGTRCNHV